MIGYYNYSVIATYVGLFSGIFGIFNALEGRIMASLICLLVSGLFDMVDGSIARKCKRSEAAKCFGMQLDSLCDLVCFGVFPAILGYVLGPGNAFTLVCMLLYITAAIIRLGFFNVQEIMKAPDAGKRTHYTGLPVTSSALLMPATALVTALPFVKSAYVYPAMLLVLSALFVSKLKIKKPYARGMIIMALIGVAVLALTIAYGGNIPCMKISTPLA